MRHNAAIKVKYELDARPVKLYLTSYGNPEAVRMLLINAMRGVRSYVKKDPELLASNLTYQAMRQTTVTFRPRDREYLWRYEINLIADIPTIRISNPSNGISETPMLFNFVGPSRIRNVPDPQPQELAQQYGKRKRGRPSLLSRDSRMRDQYVPAPLYIDPVTGEAVFDRMKK